MTANDDGAWICVETETIPEVKVVQTVDKNNKMQPGKDGNGDERKQLTNGINYSLSCLKFSY